MTGPRPSSPSPHHDATTSGLSAAALTACQWEASGEALRGEVALAGGKVTPRRQMQPHYHANVHLLRRRHVRPVCTLFVIQIAAESVRELA